MMASAVDSPIFNCNSPSYFPNRKGFFKESRFSQAPYRGGRGGRSRGGHNNYNQQSYNANTHEEDIDLQELKTVLMEHFPEEILLYSTFEKKIADKFSKTNSNVDVITNRRNPYISEEITNFGSNSLRLSSIGEASSESEYKKEIVKLRSACELKQIELEDQRKQYDVLIDQINLSVENATKKNLQMGQENKELQATLKSIAAKHENCKADLDIQLKKKETEVEKKFNDRLNSTNRLLKIEQEKLLKADENAKKTVEDKVKAVKADYELKIETLQKEKGEVEKLLEAQLNENSNLTEVVRMAQKDSDSQKTLLLEQIRETVKDSCECSICLCIFEKAVTTSCGHTFCKKCIDNWEQHLAGNNEITCPNCRTRCSYRNIHFFDDLITQLKQNFPQVEWTKIDDSSLID